MAVFQREMVSRTGWLSPERYGLAYGLSRVTPGTNLLAFCAAAGWYLQSWRGAVVTVMAVTLPSAVLVVLLTGAYQELRANPLAMGAISGIVAAAAGMTAAAAWLLARPFLVSRSWPRAVLLAGGAAALSGFSVLSPIQVLGLAAVAGYLWNDPDTA